MALNSMRRQVVYPSLGIESGRKAWRKLVKDPALGLANALERKRYSRLWDRQLSFGEANATISRMILTAQPCLVGRIGHTEGRIVGEACFRDCNFGRLSKKEAHQYSGIFPVHSESLSHFARIYGASIASADLLGFWQTAFQAKLLAEKYHEIPLAPLASLEPYLQLEPWSGALAGRRVLVVHPFASTILGQYRINRSRLFLDSRVLPEFDLRVLAPPQTLAPATGGHANWQGALDELVDKALGLDFDIALIGCGAYGLPLGAAIKLAGRQAIHLGGALQILFGIRGRRWEHMPVIAAMMNEYWIRASRDETPVSAALIDGGCYW